MHTTYLIFPYEEQIPIHRDDDSLLLIKRWDTSVFKSKVRVHRFLGYVCIRLYPDDIALYMIGTNL